MSFGGVIKLNKRGYTLITLLAVVLIYYRFHNTSKTNIETVSLADLLRTAVQAAEAGGKIVVATRNSIEVKSKGKTKEGMDDSVTTADFLSHCAMERIITKAFPQVAFISEENNTPCERGKDLEVSKVSAIHIPDMLVKSSDVTVWIDPLDATHEYTEKLYEYVTTMVCVAVKGEPLIGVIHNPFNNTTSWAVVGHGHSDDLNHAQQNSDTQKVKVIISRSHSGTIKDVLQQKFKNYELIIAAGAGYKALKVANGTADVYLHITAIKKWDICAGNAILNALGGKMTTKQGDLLSYHNDTDVVNKEGLIATLKNHELFVNKL